MAGRLPKVSIETWLETARRILIDDGIVGLKVDRIAQRLGVTRGGFYHNFKDREDFLDRLIAYWEETCKFLPEVPPPAELGKAAEWLDLVIDRLIEGDGYDQHFDLAVREWARSDKKAEWAVERADRKRMETLEKIFLTLGYDATSAEIRARIFYYHQIGYYAIGVQQSIAERRRGAKIYLDILCGEDAIAAARAAAAEAIA